MQDSGHNTSMSTPEQGRVNCQQYIKKVPTLVTSEKKGQPNCGSAFLEYLES